MTSFPVDEIIPDILTALETERVLIFHAPPGSGKTTRVPIALLDAPWLRGEKILMLEPRRLAAVNSARWMAKGLGEDAGATVGYAIRFERKHSAFTRLEIVTEGLLTRRLQNDPELHGVGLVIFDEFHERNLHGDTALALCLDLQKELRPDLRIIVMSATLDQKGMARFLPGVRFLSCNGETYPVETRYLGGPNGDVVHATLAAVLRALRDTAGDILVFLPGAGEIRRCCSLLLERHKGEGVRFLPLYGDMPFTDQEAAITPSGSRRVVLATNIAETSLTIEGVTVVIDSGLARRSRFDPATALNRLVTEKVSAASATQRAGRAGRTAPGVCYRLWSEFEQQGLIPFDAPEIMTADLCELALNLALWGVNDPAALSWPDPPPVASLAESRRILRFLGAIDDNDLLTPAGREMAQFPLHPRLAALLIAGRDSGCGPMACDLAALLSERDIFRRSNTSPKIASCDLSERLELLQEWRNRRSRGETAIEADLAALRQVDRVAAQLRSLAGISGGGTDYTVEGTGVLLTAAYPDRVAKQRSSGSGKYLLVNGRGAVLSRESGVIDAPFIVAARMDGGEGADGNIFAASALSLDDVRTRFVRFIKQSRSSFLDLQAERVSAREEELLGALVLSSRPVRPERGDVVAAILEHLRSSGSLDLFTITPQCSQFISRVLLMKSVYVDDNWPDFSLSGLLGNVSEWLEPVLMEMERPEKLKGLSLLDILKGALGWRLNSSLEQLAPTHIVVPSGSRISIDYTAEGGPVMAVKLQELFGLAETPSVAEGRVKILLHLLSPAGRPIQVTRDLRSFWDSIYPEVKKELKGRYPKHPWPDNPWSAVPTRRTLKGMGR